MPVSARTRFEIFKRDNFTCRYCGRSSPEVVLEVDHVVPTSEHGTDDPINLVSACWSCNRGKSNVPITTTISGEDPHDRAVLLLERERQLREYNVVLAAVRVRKEEEAQELLNYWCSETGTDSIRKREWTWLLNQLEHTPAERIRWALMTAIANYKTRDFRYAAACLRNWREAQETPDVLGTN